MKNKKILRNIVQGVYVLTTAGGGCVVDAVSQISASDNPLISVSVMNKNYTNELMRKNKMFALSVLGRDVDPEIIKVFGFNSMRDMNKFDKINTTIIDGINIVDDSLGYMLCEIVDYIENDTHTLFIGRLVQADVFKDMETMSYQYYQEHKEELFKVTTNAGKMAWVCSICGYVYYGEDVPVDFICPVCGVDSTLFKRQEG